MVDFVLYHNFLNSVMKLTAERLPLPFPAPGKVRWRSRSLSGWETLEQVRILFPRGQKTWGVRAFCR